MKNKIIVLSILVLIFIFSCGKKHEAVKHFENVLQTLQKGEITNASDDDLLKINPKAIKIYSEAYKKMTYKINGTTVKNEEVIINVTMKTPDLSTTLEKYMEKVQTLGSTHANKSPSEKADIEEKLMMDIIKEQMASPDLKYLNKTFDVVYVKSGNEWNMSTSANNEYIEMITFGMIIVK